MKRLIVLAIGILCAISVKAQQQKEVERVVIGKYEVLTNHLEEYVVHVHTGVVFYTQDRMGQSTELGKMTKDEHKLLSLNLNTYDYSDFSIRYKQNKDYYYVRVYYSDHDFSEAYWNDAPPVKVINCYNMVMKDVELVKSQHATTTKK